MAVTTRVNITVIEPLRTCDVSILTDTTPVGSVIGRVVTPN